MLLVAVCFQLSDWKQVKMGIAKIVFALVILQGIAAADRPCAARPIRGHSVVCVCNETYCDEITRQEPAAGRYVAYTSSKAGSRFRKYEGEFRSDCLSDESFSHILSIYPTKTRQTIEGFGGAVTDAASIQWASVNAALEAYLVNSYFGKQGNEYNMLRVPIGGSDFSTHNYAYNELPEDDAKLTNYTLAPEDFNYKIPMIQQINKVATADVHIVATVWSPPPWMKTNDKSRGLSEIKPEYYQTYAEYIAKFIREYKKYNIDVWAVTTTNEPVDAFIPITRFQDLGWEPLKMGKWIVENLGPTLKNSSDLKNVKILTVDDQRLTIPIWLDKMVQDVPEVLNWFDGVALHWYTDKFTPVKLLDSVAKNYPTKFVIGTEAAAVGAVKKVSLGSWSRAKSYAKDIIQDLNHNLVGWIDWNLCLDKQGGPNWAGNYVDSAVIVYPEKQEFWKQPMFYVMGHFSKWIPRNSTRLQVEQDKPKSRVKSLCQVAFLTPRSTIVLVVLNNKRARKVRVQLGEVSAVIELEKKSITTVEFPVPKSQ